MTLPLFMTRKMKYPVGAVMFALAYVMYRMTNQHPVFPTILLPMTWLDRTIPLVPWTVVIYVSEYIFFTVVYLTCRDADNLNKYVYSFLATQFFSCAIFFLWPTTYPRELYPIPADTPAFLQSIWTWLRNQDAATNCFPSLHVSTVYLSSYIFLDDQREKFPFFFIWGTMIALSTLPTKQHYVADVVAGWVLSVTAYWLFHRKIQYRKVGPAAEAAALDLAT